MLCEALAGYKHLTDLKLNNFKINEEAAKSLAKALQSNFSLKSLDLSWNEIAAKEYEELMNGLKQSKTVSYVTLANSPLLQRQQATSITLQGTEGLGGAEPLDVSGIVNALHEFIRRNRSLLHLDLSFMSLKKDEVLWIGQACSKSRTLLSIHLTGNVSFKDCRRHMRRIMRPRKRLKDADENFRQPDPDDQNIATPTTTQKILK